MAALVLTYFAWPIQSESEPQLVEATGPHRTSRESREFAAGEVGYPSRTGAKAVAANLFESHSWFVAPPPPPSSLSSAPSIPTAPPLPFAFLGSYARAGELPVFFLVKDDRIFDARVGDVLENQYSVDAAESGQLRMTYLPLGIKQSLALGATK